MAFRAVVKRGKTLACKGWHNYRRDSGIPSAISIINRSIFPNHGPCLSIPLLNLSCRHYYLPPAPSFCYRPDVEIKKNKGSEVVFAVDDFIEEASPIALFALLVQNKSQTLNEKHLVKHLVKWELVDESFRYPFVETRVVRIAKNILCRIKHHDDLDTKIMKSPCSPSSDDESGLKITKRPDEIVNYAVDALEVLEKKAVMNDSREFSLIYVVLEASEIKEEVVKWHAVDELVSGPLQKNLNAEASELQDEERKWLSQ